MLPKLELECQPLSRSAANQRKIDGTMRRRFLIAKQRTVITATELDGTGSQATYAPILRFTSLPELVSHFAGLGAPEDALATVETMFQAAGVATLEFQAGDHAEGV